MVSYGPWTQDPDYTTEGYLTDSGRVSDFNQLGVTAFPRAYHQTVIDSEGGPVFIENGTLADILTLVQDNVSKELDGAASHNNAVVTEISRAAVLIDFDPDRYKNYGRAAIGHAPYPILFSPVNYYPDNSPEDAVGIEWLNHPEWLSENNGFGIADRVGAALAPQSELRHFGSSNVARDAGYFSHIAYADLSRALAGTYYREAGEGELGITANLHSELRSTINGTVTLNLGVELDLTPYIDLDEGGVLYTYNTGFVPHSGAGDYDQLWSYGVRLLRPLIRQTLRPPVYRWVYDTVPIQQTSHRDDHLAGGAYQTWPAPTSRQLSNTTFGGYS